MKFIAALLALLIALMAQFWFASASLYIDFSLAALIALALLLNFWETLALSLTAIFLLNWQPAVSPELFFIGLFPLAVNLFHAVVPWRAWVVAPGAIVLGTVGMYLSVSPSFITNAPGGFFIDLLGSLIFGALVFFPLARVHHLYARHL